MKKKYNLILGIGVIVAGWLIGYIVWSRLGESIRLSGDARNYAGIFLAIAWIPPVIIFADWYSKFTKELKKTHGNTPSIYPFAISGSILTICLAIAPMILFDYVKVFQYVVIELVFILIGNWIAYFVGEPK